MEDTIYQYQTGTQKTFVKQLLNEMSDSAVSLQGRKDCLLRKTNGKLHGQHTGYKNAVQNHPLSQSSCHTVSSNVFFALFKMSPFPSVRLENSGSQKRLCSEKWERENNFIMVLIKFRLGLKYVKTKPSSYFLVWFGFFSSALSLGHLKNIYN